MLKCTIPVFIPAVLPPTIKRNGVLFTTTLRDHLHFIVNNSELFEVSLVKKAKRELLKG